MGWQKAIEGSALHRVPRWLSWGRLGAKGNFTRLFFHTTEEPSPNGTTARLLKVQTILENTSNFPLRSAE